MKQYKVLTVNPDSTSAKVTLLEGEGCLYLQNISHEAKELEQYAFTLEQLPYCRDTALKLLKEAGIRLEEVDVLVGRGGDLIVMEGGTYGMMDLTLEHTRTCANDVIHPAALGPQLANEFAQAYGVKAMVVNPPDVDGPHDFARMTGIRGIHRIIHPYALSLKETAIRHSKNATKKPCGECSYVVCHIGGGISISVHKKGRMTDGYDIVEGKGPIAPTRCGSISVTNLLEYMKMSQAGPEDVKKLCISKGDSVNCMGISDAIELTEWAKAGDRYAGLLWNSMIYQIEKCIGAMATVFHGQVDGALLGGGMVHSQGLIKRITDACSFIAPAIAYPGKFEMEAMAAGAIRVPEGEEELKTYTGRPVWDGFD